MNWPALGWMIALLFANGFFVAAEFAYITARRNVVAELNGRSPRVAVGLMRDLSVSLAGAQLGITMASLLLGAVAEPAIASMLESALGFLDLPESTLHAISLVIALLIVVFLHMVIGEMAPKNVAIASPERLAILLALPFRTFIVLFRPVIALLNGFANWVLALFRVEPVDALEMGHTAEDLAVIIGSGQKEGVIGDFAHNLLTGAIAFGDRDAADVMTPRPDVVATSTSATVNSILDLMTQTGHSRIPLHTGDIDDMVGFVHIKDLIALDADQGRQAVVQELIRPSISVPESAGLRSVLASMQKARSHLSVVIDEHGSVVGIVTLEDVAEELIGEIADEYDSESKLVTRLDGGALLVDGTVRIDELASLGISLPEGEYTTLGGLLMTRLGRIPRRGDTFTEDEWRFEVQTTSRRRVGRVRVSSATPPSVTGTTAGSVPD